MDITCITFEKVKSQSISGMMGETNNAVAKEQDSNAANHAGE